MKLSLRHLLSASVVGLLQVTASFATNPLVAPRFSPPLTAKRGQFPEVAGTLDVSGWMKLLRSCHVC